MKKISKAIVVSLLLQVPLWGIGQSLHLDQSAYMEGDTIYGVAYFSNSKLLNFTYHVSIFSSNEELVSSSMFHFKGSSNPFYLPVPSGTQSGFYTLQITNYQNSIPTHSKEVLIVNEEDWMSVYSSSPRESTLYDKKSLDINYSLISDQRAKIELQPTYTSSELIDNISVSITDLYQNTSVEADHNLDKQKELLCDLTRKHHIADRGLNTWLTGYQIEGWVYDSEGNPLNDQSIMLSIKQDQLYFNHTKTNAEGKFGFYNLDQQGEFTAYIHSQVEDTTVKSTLQLQAPRKNLIQVYKGCNTNQSIDSASLAEIVRMRTLNRKVKDGYKEFKRKPAWDPELPKPLLINPDVLIDLDDYVAFSDMRKTIKEIVSHVFFVKGRLRVFSPERSKTLEGMPIILINGVPVSDQDVINLLPTNVKYIEVINNVPKLARTGSFALGGIISVVTKNNYEYGPNVSRISMTGLAKEIEYPEAIRKDSQPFFPSTLYWNKNLTEKEDGSFEFNFEIPDYPTELYISTVIHLIDGSTIYQDEIIKSVND